MRIIITATTLALAVSLGACGAQTANRTIYSERQPVVTRDHFVLDLATAGGGLAGGEASRLSEWFGALDLGYGDRVSIDDSGYSGGARGAVADLAAQYGLLLSDPAPVTAGNVPTGALRVVVSRSVAYVPGCPDWSQRSHTDYQARTSANYGCGVNSTMSAMIADPEDLVRGQAAEGTDQSQASKAIRAYRDKPPGGQ